MDSVVTEKEHDISLEEEEDEEEEEDDDVYEVEKIVGVSTSPQGSTLYKVRWAGYSPSWDTWEPRENLLSCLDMIEDYTKQEEEKRKAKEEERRLKREQESAGNIKKRKLHYAEETADEEVDTVKDTFWRDLEEGKINVFQTGDLYSKVKSQGRAARPTSFTPLFTSPKCGSTQEEERAQKQKGRKGRRPSKSSKEGDQPPKSSAKSQQMTSVGDVVLISEDEEVSTGVKMKTKASAGVLIEEHKGENETDWKPTQEQPMKRVTPEAMSKNIPTDGKKMKKKTKKKGDKNKGQINVPNDDELYIEARKIENFPPLRKKLKMQPFFENPTVSGIKFKSDKDQGTVNKIHKIKKKQTKQKHNKKEGDKIYQEGKPKDTATVEKVPKIKIKEMKPQAVTDRFGNASIDSLIVSNTGKKKTDMGRVSNLLNIDQLNNDVKYHNVGSIKHEQESGIHQNAGEMEKMNEQPTEETGKMPKKKKIRLEEKTNDRNEAITFSDSVATHGEFMEDLCVAITTTLTTTSNITTASNQVWDTNKPSCSEDCSVSSINNIDRALSSVDMSGIGTMESVAPLVSGVNQKGSRGPLPSKDFKLDLSRCRVLLKPVSLTANALISKQAESTTLELATDNSVTQADSLEGLSSMVVESTSVDMCNLKTSGSEALVEIVHNLAKPGEGDVYKDDDNSNTTALTVVKQTSLKLTPDNNGNRLVSKKFVKEERSVFTAIQHSIQDDIEQQSPIERPTNQKEGIDIDLQNSSTVKMNRDLKTMNSNICIETHDGVEMQKPSDYSMDILISEESGTTLVGNEIKNSSTIGEEHVASMAQPFDAEHNAMRDRETCSENQAKGQCLSVGSAIQAKLYSHKKEELSFQEGKKDSSEKFVPVPVQVFENLGPAQEPSLEHSSSFPLDTGTSTIEEDASLEMIVTEQDPPPKIDTLVQIVLPDELKIDLEKSPENRADVPPTTQEISPVKETSGKEKMELNVASSFQQESYILELNECGTASSLGQEEQELGHLKSARSSSILSSNTPCPPADTQQGVSGALRSSPLSKTERNLEDTIDMMRNTSQGSDAESGHALIITPTKEETVGSAGLTDEAQDIPDKVESSCTTDNATLEASGSVDVALGMSKNAPLLGKGDTSSISKATGVQASDSIICSNAVELTRGTALPISEAEEQFPKLDGTLKTDKGFETKTGTAEVELSTVVDKEPKVLCVTQEKSPAKRNDMNITCRENVEAEHAGFVKENETPTVMSQNMALTDLNVVKILSSKEETEIDKDSKYIGTVCHITSIADQTGTATIDLLEENKCVTTEVTPTISTISYVEHSPLKSTKRPGTVPMDIFDTTADAYTPQFATGTGKVTSMNKIHMKQVTSLNMKEDRKLELHASCTIPQPAVVDTSGTEPFLNKENKILLAVPEETKKVDEKGCFPKAAGDIENTNNTLPGGSNTDCKSLGTLITEMETVQQVLSHEKVFSPSIMGLSQFTKSERAEIHEENKTVLANEAGKVGASANTNTNEISLEPAAQSIVETSAVNMHTLRSVETQAVCVAESHTAETCAREHSFMTSEKFKNEKDMQTRVAENARQSSCAAGKTATKIPHATTYIDEKGIEQNEMETEIQHLHLKKEPGVEGSFENVTNVKIENGNKEQVEPKSSEESQVDAVTCALTSTPLSISPSNEKQLSISPMNEKQSSLFPMNEKQSSISSTNEKQIKSDQKVSQNMAFYPAFAVTESYLDKPSITKSTKAHLVDNSPTYKPKVDNIRNTGNSEILSLDDDQVSKQRGSIFYNVIDDSDNDSKIVNLGKLTTNKQKKIMSNQPSLVVTDKQPLEHDMMINAGKQNDSDGKSTVEIETQSAKRTQRNPADNFMNKEVDTQYAIHRERENENIEEKYETGVEKMHSSAKKHAMKLCLLDSTDKGRDLETSPMEEKRDNEASLSDNKKEDKSDLGVVETGNIAHIKEQADIRTMKAEQEKSGKQQNKHLSKPSAGLHNKQQSRALATAKISTVAHPKNLSVGKNEVWMSEHKESTYRKQSGKSPEVNQISVVMQNPSVPHPVFAGGSKISVQISHREDNHFKRQKSVEEPRDVKPVPRDSERFKFQERVPVLSSILPTENNQVMTPVLNVPSSDSSLPGARDNSKRQDQQQLMASEKKGKTVGDKQDQKNKMKNYPVTNYRAIFTQQESLKDSDGGFLPESPKECIANPFSYVDMSATASEREPVLKHEISRGELVESTFAQPNDVKIQSALPTDLQSSYSGLFNPPRYEGVDVNQTKFPSYSPHNHQPNLTPQNIPAYPPQNPCANTATHGYYPAVQKEKITAGSTSLAPTIQHHGNQMEEQDQDLEDDIILEEFTEERWSEMGAELLQAIEISNSDLKHAVKEGMYNRVRKALNSQKQYNLEQPDQMGMTLVMLAAAKGFEDLVELLVINGANMNGKAKTGNTPLMFAAENGHLCTVAVLSALGAHINTQNGSQESALIKATKKGHKQIVKMLLENGADFSTENATGNTAMKYAKLMNNVELQAILNQHVNKLTALFTQQVYLTINNTAETVCSLFPLRVLPLNEGDKFVINFNHELEPTAPGVGMLLFIAHARITPQEVKCRLSGPCAVKTAILNGVPQPTLTDDGQFALSFSPLHNGKNELVIHTVPAPTSRAKLVVCAYKAKCLPNSEH